MFKNIMIDGHTFLGTDLSSKVILNLGNDYNTIKNDMLEQDIECDLSEQDKTVEIYIKGIEEPIYISNDLNDYKEIMSLVK